MYHKFDCISIGLRETLEVAIISRVINGYPRKYPFKDFERRTVSIDPWYLTSGCDSRRQKDSLATFRNWKHRGLSSGRESSCFRRKSIAHRGNRRNRAKSLDFDWPIFRGSIQTRILLRQNGLLFSFAYLLYPGLCNRIGNTTIAWKDNSDSRCHRVFFHYRFGQERFIFLAALRIYLASCSRVIGL